MRRPTAAHLKLLKHAQDGDSMFGAVREMLSGRIFPIERLFYELVDGNMIEHCARDEPMHLTRLCRGGAEGRPDIKRPPLGRP